MKNANIRQKLVIYQNLTGGGSKRIYDETYKYLAKYYRVVSISDDKFNDLANKNIIYYMFVSLILLRYQGLKLSKSIIGKKIVAHHSWITKSPYILRYTNLPTVYICHEPPREFYDKEYIKTFSYFERFINFVRLPLKYIDKRNIDKCHNLKIIANSNFSKKMIADAYQKNSLVIYPGINLKKWKNKTHNFNNIDHSPKQVISVGSINKLKNQLFFAKILSLIPEKNRPKLLLIGNGGNSDYIRIIQSFCKKNKVNCEININISDKQLVKAYANSALFLYAPINEPFGIVVLEAMASGLPIVASADGGGYAEVLTNDNGRIVNSKNPEYWANIIEKFITDNNSLRTFSKYNSTYANKYSDLIMNKKILEILKSI